VLTFSKTWIVDEVLTNADSVTIGIYDDTAGLQAVPAGTAMTNASAGQYSYEFDAEIAEHAYTATITVVYEGNTSTYTATSPASTSATCDASEGLECHSHRLNRAVAENAAGALSVSSAAGSMQAHPLDKQILAADRQAAIEARRRGSPGFAVFRIGGDSPR